MGRGLDPGLLREPDHRTAQRFEFGSPSVREITLHGTGAFHRQRVDKIQGAGSIVHRERNTVGLSIVDGMGMGLGFTLGLAVLGGVREIFGAGTLLGFPVFGDGYPPALVMILPPGAFLTLGLLLAGMNKLEEKRAIRAGEAYRPPREMDCGSCVLCNLSENLNDMEDTPRAAAKKEESPAPE